MKALKLLALLLFFCHQGAYARCGISNRFESDPKIAVERVFDESDFVGFVRSNFVRLFVRFLKKSSRWRD